MNAPRNFSASRALRLSALLSLLLAALLAPPLPGAAAFEDKKENKKDNKSSEKQKQLDKLSAEQLAEVVVAVYGGRAELQHVRTNGSEEGIIKLVTDDKEIEGRIIRKFLRKDANLQDLTRIDVELPTQKLTFGFNGYTVWAARDGVNFTPNAEAEQSFLGSLVHNYDALLRYKELGGTLERAGSDSLVGIDVEKLDLTHKDGSKTRYYISSKTYRILHLEYELKLQAQGEATKFRESFFDFRPIQNTLVPSKTVLFENGRKIQEIQITQAKYHGSLAEESFLKY